MAGSQNNRVIFVILLAGFLVLFFGLGHFIDYDPNRLPVQSSSSLYNNRTGDAWQPFSENDPLNQSTTTIQQSGPRKREAIDFLRELAPMAMNDDDEIAAYLNGSKKVAGGAQTAADDAGLDDEGTDGGLGIKVDRTPLYPGCHTSRFAKQCAASVYAQCNNKGADKCQWRHSACNFNNYDCRQLYAMFENRTFMFRGDSTLREQFSAWGYYCCPGVGPVLKNHTNMTNRETVSRINKQFNIQSYFHFDYLLDHLMEPLPQIVGMQSATDGGEGRQIDVMAIGLGMYHAKAITTGQKDAMSIEQIRERIPNVITSICDLHKAKVGFVVGGWMECAAMKKNKAKAVRQNSLVCPQSARIVSHINKMYQTYLRHQPPRKDGCYVHYVPAYRCRNQKHVCTGDGVHARSNGNYGNSKFQLLFNAVKAVMLGAPVSSPLRQVPRLNASGLPIVVTPKN